MSLTQYYRERLSPRDRAAYDILLDRWMHMGDQIELPPPEGRLEDLISAVHWYCSLVFYVKAEGVSALLTGDVDDSVEKLMAGDRRISDVDILKVSHHGSRFGTCRELLDEAKPEAAVISCARYNRYGHPDRNVVKRLTQCGAWVLRTYWNGCITFICREDGYDVETYIK